MTQDDALAILKTGANVFLTGEPGSGKTHTVNALSAHLRSHGIEPSITASTGIAATHVGGMTIHSWSGIGIKRTLSPYELDALLGRESLQKRLAAARVLIIDEISMLDAAILDSVDRVLKISRQSDRPFGGLQVVFVGDFFQLPPIPEAGEEARFAFESYAWRSANPITCYLTEQHRQDDAAYLSTLSAIRRGDIDDAVYAHLETRAVDRESQGNVTRLYTHNADVDHMNEQELARIEGEQRAFVMDAHGNSRLVEGLKKNCMSPETLTVKVGATVMFTKNNFEAGFVNGTLGTVTGFDSYSGRPIVTVRDGRTIVAEAMEWSVEDSGKVLAQVTQVPLRLAWAITVHKSQGMSLDAAHMDLSRSFEYGQGYVALSRVRSIDGLFLQGINARALEVHPKVLSVDGLFRENSEAAEQEFDAMDKAELSKLHADCILGMGGTLHVESAHKNRNVAPKGGKLAETRKKYPNAGRPWPQEDSDEMVRRFGEGESKKDIALRFGRKPSAIHARLVQLGIIDPDELYVSEEE